MCIPHLEVLCAGTEVMAYAPGQQQGLAVGQLLSPLLLPAQPPACRPALANFLQEEAQVRRALNLSFASNLVLLVVRVAIAAISGSLSLVVATLDAVLDVVSSGGWVGGGVWGA